MAATLEQRIQILEDREAIKELTARYCRHIARGEGGLIVDTLFTEDGVFDGTAGGLGRFSGREQLAGFFTKVKPEHTLPLIHNHIIELRGDEASGTCSVESRVQRGKLGGFVGYYLDRYRRERGGWRFSERKATVYDLPRQT